MIVTPINDGKKQKLLNIIALLTDISIQIENDSRQSFLSIPWRSNNFTKKRNSKVCT